MRGVNPENPGGREVPAPKEIAQALERRVLGQQQAVREMAIALSKKLAGLPTGNILLVGSSGTGKTTLMRAVERYLAADPTLAHRSTLIRVHANVLAATEGPPGEALLVRLLDRAREQLGAQASTETLLERVGHGLVFVDEVDKIRSRVAGQPNPAGIRAQEALLTVIENEAVPLTLPEWAGGETVAVDSSGLLFVCAGAFEGLYDAVFDRVTVGRDRGALQSVTVMGEGSGELREELDFHLRDWLRVEDLFDYGMTPQFLSRFDAMVLLEDLSEDDLVRIFLDTPDSGLAQARVYFASRGIELAISPAAVRRVAREAALQPRLGARALKEAFRRVLHEYEFEPERHAPAGVLMLDTDEVERALTGA